MAAPCFSVCRCTCAGTGLNRLYCRSLLAHHGPPSFLKGPHSDLRAHGPCSLVPLYLRDVSALCSGGTIQVAGAEAELAAVLDGAVSLPCSAVTYDSRAAPVLMNFLVT